MVLTSSFGTHLGLLVRMRDLLPGSYAFGLTGRDLNGNVLPAGDYTPRAGRDSAGRQPRDLPKGDLTIK